jgi:hypothetical protein
MPWRLPLNPFCQHGLPLDHCTNSATVTFNAFTISPMLGSLGLLDVRGKWFLTPFSVVTDLVLLIRRTVRPRGYASCFDSPAALLDELFEHPAGTRASCSIRADY